MTTRCALSIGSNLGDRAGALQFAVAALAELPGVSGVEVSSLYETDPVGGIDQPDFLNVVAVADAGDESPLAVAHSLLGLASRVERDLHRVRKVRWGPRTVDVDVLAVGDLTSDDPELTVPHPRIAERAFVLVPWCEIDPHFRVPGMGSVASLLARLPVDEVGGVRLAGPWT